MISDHICTDLTTQAEFIIPDNNLPINTFKFDFDTIKECDIDCNPTVLIIEFGVTDATEDGTTGKLVIVSKI